MRSPISSAVEERPRGFAVEKEHRVGLAMSLVHVMHPQSVELEVMRLERICGKTLEPLLGRAVNVHVRYSTMWQPVITRPLRSRRPPGQAVVRSRGRVAQVPRGGEFHLGGTIGRCRPGPA
jgi:hypothetical protein